MTMALQTKRASGGNLPAETWKKYMVGAHNGMTVAGLPGVSMEQIAETRRKAGGEKKPWINPDLLPEGQSTMPLPKERKGLLETPVRQLAGSPDDWVSD